MGESEKVNEEKGGGGGEAGTGGEGLWSDWRVR